MQPLSVAPPRIRSGDSVAWREPAPAYLPADGWEVRATLTGPSAPLTITGTWDAYGWTLTLTTTQTAALTPGLWSLATYAVATGKRETISVRALRVDANPVITTGTRDTRSHARKVLDAIEAWLERRASWAAQLSIEGRAIQQYPVADLLKLRDRYRAEVQREEIAGRIGRGEHGAKKLMVRFP